MCANPCFCCVTALAVYFGAKTKSSHKQAWKLCCCILWVPFPVSIVWLLLLSTLAPRKESIHYNVSNYQLPLVQCASAISCFYLTTVAVYVVKVVTDAKSSHLQVYKLFRCIVCGPYSFFVCVTAVTIYFGTTTKNNLKLACKFYFYINYVWVSFPVSTL